MYTTKYAIFIEGLDTPVSSKTIYVSDEIGSKRISETAARVIIFTIDLLVR